IPQRALGHLSPVQARQDWQERCPALFKKQVYNLTGLDNYRPTHLPPGGSYDLGYSHQHRGEGLWR
ncbi:MAG: hypothetical protein WAT36_09065, partial [Chromatiaceae bacterium]